MIFKAVAFTPLLLASGHKLKTVVEEPHYEKFHFESPMREKVGHIKIPPAEAINMTEPRYFCTKPGFELRGHKCVLTERAPVQHVCPPGYERFDSSDTCFRSVPALFHCPRGVLKGDLCEVKHFSPVIYFCPDGYHETHDKKCRDTKPVDLVPECRGDAVLMHGKCVSYIYSSPDFLCPPNSVQDGKKCRIEEEIIVSEGKKMHRKLEEVEEVELEGEGEGAVVEEGWNQGNKIKVKYAKIPVAVEKKILVKTKEIKVKIPKEKAPKLKTVIKVKLFNAEKVCEKGVPTGKSCVEEHISHPEHVCPVPRIEGECVRERFIAPDVRCKDHHAHLRCGDGHFEEKCRCETIETFPATPYCPDGGVLEHEVCVFHVDALETCPLGFKFDHIQHQCIAVTIEEAECEFVVTYMCADCDKNRPEFKEVYFHK